MAVIHRQRVAGGTATYELKLVDFDTGLAIVADTVPRISVYDPRGRPMVINQLSEPLGGGIYIYNYTIPVGAVKGFHKGIFTYEVLGTPFADDALAQVV